MYFFSLKRFRSGKSWIVLGDWGGWPSPLFTSPIQVKIQSWISSSIFVSWVWPSPWNDQLVCDHRSMSLVLVTIFIFMESKMKQTKCLKKLLSKFTILVSYSVLGMCALAITTGLSGIGLSAGCLLILFQAGNDRWKRMGTSKIQVKLQFKYQLIGFKLTGFILGHRPSWAVIFWSNSHKSVAFLVKFGFLRHSLSGKIGFTLY